MKQKKYTLQQKKVVLRARSKKWNAAHPKRRAEIKRKWNQANLDINAVHSQKWRKKYPEKHKEKNKSWKEKNPDKYFAINLGTRYKMIGFSGQDYFKLHKKQKGFCAICKQTNGKYRLAVDHCHTKMKARGLLCRMCNLMLGYAKDNPKLLAAAIKYLKKSI